MKVSINSVDYRQISDLSFAPEIDIVGNTLTINQFIVDIRTPDTIDVNRKAYLYGEDDKLWAAYTIVDVQDIGNGEKRIIAQSPIALLAKRTLPAVMYNNEPITNVLTVVFGGVVYHLDSRYNGETITGYMPEQSARERLQWATFSIGAYVKSYFDEDIWINPIDPFTATIPPERIYWQPKVTYQDIVTKVTVRTYSYTSTAPASTDKWVEVNGSYYIETTRDVSLVNPDVPSYAADNEILIDGVKIMNSDNVSAVLTRLSDYYFSRQHVDADVLNPGDYVPGQRVRVFLDNTNYKEGYITSASFIFGYQQKSKLTLTMAEDGNVLMLTVIDKWDEYEIGKQKYRLAAGAQYTIDNLFVDRMLDGHRYVFRPLDAQITGTMGNTNKTVTQDYEIALDLYKYVLDIISVDELTEEEGIVKIA